MKKILIIAAALALAGCGWLPDIGGDTITNTNINNNDIRIDQGSCPRGGALCAEDRLPDPGNVDPALNLTCTVDTSGSHFVCTATGTHPGETFELLLTRQEDQVFEIISPYVLGTEVNRTAGTYNVVLRSLSSGRESAPKSAVLTQ